MKETVNQNELISAVSGRTNSKQTQCKRILKAFEEAITDALKEGRTVRLKGFFRAIPTERTARYAMNPKTGEMQDFPAVKSANVTISATIRNKLNERDI